MDRETTPDASRFGVCTEDELMTSAPPGRYILSDAAIKTERVYLVTRDEFVEGATCLFGVVRQNEGIWPMNCDIAIRPDGFQVIRQRVLINI